MSCVSPGRRSSRERGFTLVELLVVLVILGLLATIAVPQVMGYLDRSRTDTAALQVKRLSSVLDLYRLDVGRYPTEDEGLQALVRDPGVAKWRGPYLEVDEGLIDPWGTPYLYETTGERSFRIVSLGADGVTGGEGVDADIVRAR